MFYRPAIPLPAEVLCRRNVEFTTAAWRAGLRPDQRAPDQLRELNVRFPLMTRDVVQIQLGGTAATATVSCELVEPSPYRPKHGFFEVRVRQLLNERDAAGLPRELKRIGLFLERLFKGGVIETEGLCVLPGRRVWSIVVDVVVTNDAGNVQDAAQWAAMAALMHFRRPELTIRGDSVVVHPPHERDPVPLSLHHTPISCSFAVTVDPAALEVERRTAQVRGGSTAGDVEANKRAAATAAAAVAAHALRVVLDPSAEERAAAASTVTVAVNAEGQVCALEKGEGCDVRWAQLQACVAVATLLVPRVLEAMTAAMVAHDERRKRAVKGQFLWAQTRSGVGAGNAEKDETAATAQENAPAAKKSRAETEEEK